MPLTDKTLRVTLPPKSVSTYVVPGAVYAGSPGFCTRDFYRLINVGSGLALRSGSNRQWGLLGLGNDQYEVIGRTSGLVLDVSTALKTPGAQVIEYGFAGGENQIWHAAPAGDGQFVFLNKNSGLALAMDKTGALTQQTPNGSASLRWRVVQSKTSD